MTALPATSIGPPPKDLFASQADLPATDALLEAAIKTITPASSPRAGVSRYVGQANYDHATLVGPPTRLQGGLHGPGRTLALLPRIAEHHAGLTFPCAYSIRIGAGIKLFENVPFVADYEQSDSAWWLATRFANSDKLSGMAWSLTAAHSVLSAADLPVWQQRYQRALKLVPQARDVLNIPHYDSDDLFWAEFDLPRLFSQFPGLRRFSADGQTVGTAFMTYYMDSVAILSQAVKLLNPMFTIQMGVAFAQATISTDRKILILADRANTQEAPLSTAKPLLINGQFVSSRIIQVICTNSEFTQLYARGWATGHPMDLQLMMSKLVAKPG